MPTDKPRFTITLDQELLSRIDNYKYSHRMKNQNQAVVSLIEKGFDSLFIADPKTKKLPAPEGTLPKYPPDSETDIAIVTRALEGQSEAKKLLIRIIAEMPDDLADAIIAYMNGRQKASDSSASHAAFME